MPLSLHDVRESDFPAVMECLWEAFENPLQHLFRLFCPLNAVGAHDRSSALKESTERFWQWHITDSSSYWHKVVDTDTNGGERIAGAALWKLYTTNPHEQPEEHEAYWHPEGGQREFASQALAQHEATRERLAQRPHVCTLHSTYFKED